MNWKAARTSAWLAVLFLVVYGASNWLTTLRANVGSFHFAWERYIPFVPLMIVPYMSIDLFFVAAPFVCRDERERRTLARRLTAAILIATACFLLFPLRFAFDRPHLDGWLGLVFNHFRQLDPPFNQCPSLHVALCVILAGVYARRTRGALRAALGAWFVLIGCSAVLTYQHHAIDIIGGLVLAVTCLHLVQDEPLRQPALGNRRVGLFYLAGAVVLGLGAFVAGPWTWLLLWPAGSLLLVAAAYFGLGPGIFRKRGGRLPLTTWLVLGPVLLGHRLALIHYARQRRPWDALTDRLWIGRQLSAAEARHAIAAGVTAVLDLTGEFAEARPFLGLAYRQLPILDLTAPTPAQLDQAVAWLEDHAARGVVYVHCKIGYSRTAAVAGAYLLASGRASSADEASALLRAARPGIVIRPEAGQALRRFTRSSSAAAPSSTSPRG